MLGTALARPGPLASFISAELEVLEADECWSIPCPQPGAAPTSRSDSSLFRRRWISPKSLILSEQTPRKADGHSAGLPLVHMPSRSSGGLWSWGQPALSQLRRDPPHTPGCPPDQAGPLAEPRSSYSGRCGTSRGNQSMHWSTVRPRLATCWVL